MCHKTIKLILVRIKQSIMPNAAHMQKRQLEHQPFGLCICSRKSSYVWPRQPLPSRLVSFALHLCTSLFFSPNVKNIEWLGSLFKLKIFSKHMHKQHYTDCYLRRHECSLFMREWCKYSFQWFIFKASSHWYKVEFSSCKSFKKIRDEP